MPQWRKTHEKIIESLDFNDMPDDFTRVTWMLLPLKVDREGRGIYNPAWIKSKLHPLRMDVTSEMCQAAMDWFREHEMIKVYSDGRREYFYIPTFHQYQGDTSREAESTFPTPDGEEDHPFEGQEEVESKSGENQNQLPIGSSSDADADADADAKKKPRKKREPSELFQIAQAIAHVTGLDFEKNRGRLFKEAKTYKVGDIPQIQRDYGCDGPWYLVDWRGKKGQAPTPGQIRETWGNLKPINGNGYHKQTQPPAVPLEPVTDEDIAAQRAAVRAHKEALARENSQRLST